MLLCYSLSMKTVTIHGECVMCIVTWACLRPRFYTSSSNDNYRQLIQTQYRCLSSLRVFQQDSNTFLDCKSNSNSTIYQWPSQPPQLLHLPRIMRLSLSKKEIGCMILASILNAIWFVFLLALPPAKYYGANSPDFITSQANLSRLLAYSSLHEAIT